jgi:5'-methylthioadenosine phosphorylase
LTERANAGRGRKKLGGKIKVRTVASPTPRLGIIGGSGIYAMAGFEDARWVKVATNWGAPSDKLLLGEIQGLKLAFLPRHGRGHPLPPGDINYRANIEALKRVGVRDVISISACGSLREDLAPGTFVLVDQFIDRTEGRARSFFGPGLVAHVGLAHPTCGRLNDTLATAAEAAGIPVRKGGTYVAISGPQFSTQAESDLYRAWGCDVIGMTAMPEARLAREAELCYASVAMVTDYDCWHPEHAHVNVADVVKVLMANAAKGARLVRRVAPLLADRPAVCPEGCDRALDHALITAAEARDRRLTRKLGFIAGRVLRGPKGA